MVADKNMLGVKDGEKSEAAKFTSSTSFTELKFTHEIIEGKANSNDLLLKSALFSVKGEGATLLESGQLSYQLNSTISPNLKRSSGKIAELRGVTIPVYVTGPYSMPIIKLDFSNASGMQETKPAKAAPSKTPPAPVKVKNANKN